MDLTMSDAATTLTKQNTGDALILDQLYVLLKSRKDADPTQSYTARLYSQGQEKIAQKLGEEAVETIIAALGGDKGKIMRESADLLYHLLVLWAHSDLAPQEVWECLAGRFGQSGLEEKRQRQTQLAQPE
jgi:phosphoribosyl-ATP pyrophosphohydrolase